MIELFLCAALNVPSPWFTHAPIVSYHAVTEEELADRIRRINDVEDVFIHPTPHAEKMKEHGWERFPVRINGKEIWIKRKPIHDTPQKRAMEESA